MTDSCKNLSIILKKVQINEKALKGLIQQASDVVDLPIFRGGYASVQENFKIVTIIKELKSAVAEQCWKPEYGKYLTPSWREPVGSGHLTDSSKTVQFDQLQILLCTNFIIPFKPTSTNYVKQELIPLLLFTLNIFDYDDKKFRKFIANLEWYPAIGMMICHILFDDERLDVSCHILETSAECLAKKRDIVFQLLKSKLSNCMNITIIHFVSLCGDHISNMMPDKISISIIHTRLSEFDVSAITKVASSSSLLDISLRNCVLDSKSLLAIRNGLRDSVVKIHNFDISGNNKIDSEGYICLGDIVMEHSVQRLNMPWCGLSYKKLDELNKACKDAKIHCLDISSNTGINKKGYRCLGSIMEKCKPKQLNISSCGLTFGKLRAFSETSGDAEILHLDISGNSSIDVQGYYCLGEIVKKHRVKRLEMMGCGLTHEKLHAFNTTSGETKVLRETEAL